MENISGKSYKDDYVIFFSGHIDSTNALAVENAINDLKKDFSGKNLYIDC